MGQNVTPEDQQTDAAPEPAPRRGPATRWKRYAWILGGLLLGAGTLMAVSMELFFKVVAILGIALTIGSILVMLLTYRKSREIKPGAMGISIGMSLACLTVYAFFLGAGLPNWAWLAGLALGAAAGVGWSRVTPLFRDGAAVRRAGNIWYLAIWGAIFAANQALILATGRSPAVSMLLLIVGTGLVVGNSGAYIVGYYRIKAES